MKLNFRASRHCNLDEVEHVFAAAVAAIPPSRGGATQSTSTHSGGQPTKPARGGATQGQPVTKQEPTTERPKGPEGVDSDLEDLFDDF